MKKVLYLLILIVSIALVSCEKEKIGGTATQALAGEWYVRLDCVDESGNVVYTGEEFYGIGRFMLYTYNTAANKTNEIWIDDCGNFWEFKVKALAKIENLTFQANDAVNDYYDCHVTIEDGKVTLNGAITPHGTTADAIEFYVSFDDDDSPLEYGFAKYKISGYRYTGFVQDEEI
jgi:hypothetical protein